MDSLPGAPSFLSSERQERHENKKAGTEHGREGQGGLMFTGASLEYSLRCMLCSGGLWGFLPTNSICRFPPGPQPLCSDLLVAYWVVSSGLINYVYVQGHEGPSEFHLGCLLWAHQHLAGLFLRALEWSRQISDAERQTSCQQPGPKVNPQVSLGCDLQVAGLGGRGWGEENVN